MEAILGILERFFDDSGLCWSVLGASWGPLGPLWGPLSPRGAFVPVAAGTPPPLQIDRTGLPGEGEAFHTPVNPKRSADFTT